MFDYQRVLQVMLQVRILWSSRTTSIVYKGTQWRCQMSSWRSRKWTTFPTGGRGNQSSLVFGHQRPIFHISVGIIYQNILMVAVSISVLPRNLRPSGWRLTRRSDQSDLGRCASVFDERKAPPIAPEVDFQGGTRRECVFFFGQPKRKWKTQKKLLKELVFLGITMNLVDKPSSTSLG